MQKTRGPRPKHVPQRTCIACRGVEGKRSLVRLVRAETGIEVDPTGKKAGRGAYLHPYQTCWRAVLRGNRLEQALRTRLSDENRQALVAYMAALPESEAADPEAASEREQ
ncbi:MAG: YlxR family protein [Caldilineaceae bacterium]|nr:YlxR family protein [Caldilineaceae bacterium]